MIRDHNHHVAVEEVVSSCVIVDMFANTKRAAFLIEDRRHFTVVPKLSRSFRRRKHAR